MNDVSNSHRVKSKELQKSITYIGVEVDHSTIRQKLDEIMSMDWNQSEGNFSKDIMFCLLGCAKDI